MTSRWLRRQFRAGSTGICTTSLVMFALLQPWLSGRLVLAGAIEPVPVGVVPYAMCGLDVNDDGLEIASFASDGKFDLLSSAGRRLVQTKTRYPLLNIAAADVDADGFDEVLLSRLHDPCVYVLDLHKELQSAARALQQTLATDRVTEGLDRMLSQLDALRSERTQARPHHEKLHGLWGMEATIAPTLMGNTIRAIDQKMREMRCDNVEYAFMFTLPEKGVSKYKRNGICAVGPLATSGEKILERCRQWEQMGIRFYPVVSHMGVPTIMPETARKIMDVAPNACQGYLTWETLVNSSVRVRPTGRAAQPPPSLATETG